MRFRPALLHLMPGTESGSFKIPADARAFPTPRSWASCSKVVTHDRDLRFPLVSGLFGEGPAAEFEGFIRTWLYLPSTRDILADPSSAQLPTGPAPPFAFSPALPPTAPAN